MENEKKVNNWLELAKRDLAFAKDIVNRRNFRSYAPHFSHQALEKILKALVVAKTGITPPYIHNLVRLANLSKIELDQDTKDILAMLNPHYIGTKYPEDIAKMFKLYSQQKVDEVFKSAERAFKCFQKLLK
ncbi:MAG: hypothetical protein UR93_C0023G0019 [Berkelbacteria bacterium GW2011_GWA2_35_9]|uniref:HEPN domain-containing protein n=1 Tax=Berkelbacteria bacterium GW2011_GWA2_35_9 TaxID=1618333 RepID=A0A0G0FKX7_9BACT|nr:MAG: hypothetical protein UR93_C0023G0019 [Berkelbacteria bacterium GW2011_GWA2_35_9]